MEKVLRVLFSTSILLVAANGRGAEPPAPAAPLPEPSAGAGASAADVAPDMAPAAPLPSPSPDPTSGRSDVGAAAAAPAVPAERVVRIVSEATTMVIYGPSSLAATASPPSAVAGVPRPTLRGPDEELVPLCTTPCDLRLPEGDQLLGVSLDGKHVTEARRFPVSSATRELAVSYDPRPGYRAASALVLAATVVGAALLMRSGDAGHAAPATECSPNGEHCRSGSLDLDLPLGPLAGMAVIGVGVAVSVTLATRGPVVSFVPR